MNKIHIEDIRRIVERWGEKLVPNGVPMREASVLLVVIKQTPTFGEPLQIGLTRCICEYFTKSL